MTSPRLIACRLVCALALVALVTATTEVSAQPAGCPTGMTHYWKLDESTGGPFDDFYGTNDATCTNCPAAVSGKINGGQDFDGVNDRITASDDNTFDWSATSSFTIEFWLRWTGCDCTVAGYTCNQVIVGRSTAATAWWVGVNCDITNGVAQAHKVRGYFAGGVDLVGATAVNDNNWHHVVVRFDQASLLYELYVDGVLDASQSGSGQNRAGLGPLEIGHYNALGGFHYTGVLDELALYDVALPTSDIQTHYNSGSGRSYCVSNLAPVVSDIPDQQIVEGAAFAAIPLDDYVDDPDNDDSELSWTFSGDANLSVSIGANRIATITIIDPEWNGSETITFTASDLEPLSDSDPATFTVTAVNDAPVVADIPGETINEGGVFAVINLDDYVEDPDNSDTQISWSSSGNVDLQVNIVDRVATITTPNENWNGSETITFTASDLEPLSDFDAATFTVTAVNDAPVVSDIPGETILEGGSFATINLDTYVDDPDNLDSEISWTYSGNVELQVNIVSRVATISAPNAEWSGSETITFTAADLEPLTDFDAATFTITAVNDPPEVADIPDQAVLVGNAFATIALDSYVYDPDHADGDLDWTYSGNVDLSVNIDVNRVATITPPSPAWTGAETIVFTASDPLSASDFDGASFAVNADGCPPGMSHYWELNETSSGVYNDAVGSTNASCTACPTAVAGLVGGAQEFDRLTDQVIVADDGSYDWGTTSDFTIEFWLFKSTGCAGGIQPNNEVVVGRPASGWWVGVMCEAGTNQSKIRAYFQGVDIFSTTSVTDAAWHHVAFVRDNAANQWLLYVDGVLESSQVSSGKNLASSDALEIGWYNGPDPAKYRLGAILDELALYDVALSSTAIAAHHSSGLLGLGYCNFADTPPEITTTARTNAMVGQPYEYDVQATGRPVPTYSLAVFPAGMTIDDVTGLIEWMPTATGSFDVEVVASNSEGSDSQPFTIEVDPGNNCPAEMEHYWTFDETAPGSYNDPVGAADATCSDCPTPVTGKVGDAQLFDRVDDQVLIPDDDSYDWGATDSYSIEFWMKADCGCTSTDYSCNEVILSRFDITNPWWIGVSCRTSENPGKLRCYFGASTDLYSTIDVNDEVWHHVAFIRDEALGQCRLYLDGALNTTLTVAGQVRSGSNKPMQVGWANGGPFYRYGGVLDELAIYNAPLSEAQIIRHYRHGAGAPYCAICGDADGSGIITISDAVFLIGFIFGGGPAPDPNSAGDADCNGIVTISDAVFLINYIFAGGAPPCSTCK